MGRRPHCRPKPHQRPRLAACEEGGARGPGPGPGQVPSDRVGRGPVRVCTRAPLSSKLKKNVTGQETAGNAFFLLLNKGPCVFIWHRGLQITQPTKLGPRGPPGSGGSAPLRGWGHGGPCSDQCSEKVRGSAGGGGSRQGDQGGGRRAQDEGLSGPDSPRPCGEAVQCWTTGGLQIPGGAADAPGTPGPRRAREKGRRPRKHTTRECARRRSPEAGPGERRRARRTGGKGLPLSSPPCPRLPGSLPRAGAASTIRKAGPRVRVGACGQTARTLAHPSAALLPAADSARHPMPRARGQAASAPF